MEGEVDSRANELIIGSQCLTSMCQLDYRDYDITICLFGMQIIIAYYINALYDEPVLQQSGHFFFTRQYNYLTLRLPSFFCNTGYQGGGVVTTLPLDFVFGFTYHNL